MLSKFVIGTNLVDQLIELINGEPDAPQPFNLTLVAAPSDTVKEFEGVISKISDLVLGIPEKTNKSIKALSLEVKLPKQTDYESPEELKQIIDFVVQTMNKSPELPSQVFFEIPGFEFDASKPPALAKTVSDHNKLVKKEALKNYSYSAFKIRCGGVEAFQFPPVPYLASTITTSKSVRCPLKFTAGLHHPVRHFNESVDTKMHGFLNVFGASVLSYSKDLSESEIIEILSDEDPSHFTFSDNAFAWKEHSIESDELNNLRALYVTSFGSCSFDEPVEDLQELNLLK